jgi:hypothetical protein
VSSTANLNLALALTAPGERGSRTRLYWNSRITLIGHHRHLAAFDAVFASVFADHVLSPHAVATHVDAASNAVNVPLPRQDSDEEHDSGLPWATLPRLIDAASGSEGDDVPVPERRPHYIPGRDDVPFADMDPAELKRLDQALREAMHSWPQRRTRRDQARPRGARIAMRRTVARSRRTGWEAITLEREGPVARDRRLVIVCDVSQSMQAYATAYLHFMRVATRAVDSEIFAFGTTLTRLTNVLSQVSPDHAIAEASLQVTDRFGGTRIAASLRELLHSHHGNSLRGAVCIIASDGWDSDPPQELAAQMARLRRRAHRVIWLNPRAAEDGFEPLTGGMAAALPYCDEFLPAHTVAGLTDVIDAITNKSPSTRRRQRI